MKIHMLSTLGEPCGIATYARQLGEALDRQGHTLSAFPIDRTRLATLARRELDTGFETFRARICDADALILQHEDSLYAGAYSRVEANEVFASLVTAAARAAKPTVAIFHTDPARVTSAHAVRHPRAFWRHRRSWRRLVNILNGATAVRAIVHGAKARRLLIDSGVDGRKVTSIEHPLPEPFGAPRRPLTPAAPIRLTIFGFVNRYKGYETALRALLHLPHRVTLTIAGAPHPRNGVDRTLDSIQSFLATGTFTGGELEPLSSADRAAAPSRLAGRVTLTGYLDDQSVRRVFEETDFVLAPYTSEGPAASGAVTWGMAAQRPVVATTVRTFLEINAVGPCLHLVAPQAPLALAREILWLAEHPAEQQRLLTEAACYMRDRTWSQAARFVAGQLTALADGPSRG